MVVSGVIHSWQLELARFLAPAVAAFTAFAALFSLFREQMQLFRLRMMHRHVVVCGIGRKGIALVRDYNSQGLRVVVIESDDENDNIAICREFSRRLHPFRKRFFEFPNFGGCHSQAIALGGIALKEILVIVLSS
jgi:voltage-gated potassium channel Kch